MTMRDIAITLLLVGVTAVAQPTAVQASGIPASERQALIDLYNATGGASWTTNDGWNGAAGTECTWHGVVCNGGKTTVQRLVLWKDNLVGTLPASLGSLTSLQYLILHSNQLTGSLPTQLGNLTNLQEFWLSDNQLTGSIPTSLGGLTNLTHLWLEENQLTGSIPTSLGRLTNLQYLVLSDNQLSGPIPTSLGSLPNLLGLELSRNQLTGPIPSELGSLTNLTGLGLSENQLTGSIPTWLGSLTKLQSLYLNGNMLSGALPTSLESLTKLGVGTLDLRWNALYSTDGTLTTFLNGKQTGGDWQSSQTVAPTGLAVGATTSTSVTLSWTPIAYTADSGGYQAHYSTTSGGPYTSGDIATDKSASSIEVGGLTPGTLYYFVIRTITNPVGEGANLNTVTSDPSAEVHATTTSCTSPSITSQPQSQNIQSGQTATLSVTATGDTPLSYQWYQGSSGDTSNPVGTNESSFTTPALTASASYWVRVSNSCGHADSATAAVTVGNRLRRHLQRTH